MNGFTAPLYDNNTNNKNRSSENKNDQGNDNHKNNDDAAIKDDAITAAPKRLPRRMSYAPNGTATTMVDEKPSISHTDHKRPGKLKSSRLGVFGGAAAGGGDNHRKLETGSDVFQTNNKNYSLQSMFDAAPQDPSPREEEDLSLFETKIDVVADKDTMWVGSEDAPTRHIELNIDQLVEQLPAKPVSSPEKNERKQRRLRSQKVK